MIPIRSCLRMDDELVSNYGPVHHKHVRFADTKQCFGDIVTSTNNSTFPPLSRPRCWRIKSRNVISELVKSGQKYSDPYSIWDLSSSTPITLKNYKRHKQMVMIYDDAETFAPKPNAFPIFSCIKRPESRKKKLRVSFSYFETTIFADGRTTQSAAATEVRGELWRSDSLHNSPIYVMNCQSI